VALCSWDTAGQERFKCIAASYYRSSNGKCFLINKPGRNHSSRILNAHRGCYLYAVIVTIFDASNLETLSTCQKWMDDAVGANSSNPLKFLVATKMDLVVSTSIYPR